MKKQIYREHSYMRIMIIMMHNVVISLYVSLIKKLSQSNGCTCVRWYLTVCAQCICLLVSSSTELGCRPTWRNTCLFFLINGTGAEVTCCLLVLWDEMDKSSVETINESGGGSSNTLPSLLLVNTIASLLFDDTTGGATMVSSLSSSSPESGVSMVEFRFPNLLLNFLIGAKTALAKLGDLRNCVDPRLLPVISSDPSLFLLEISTRLLLLSRRRGTICTSSSVLLNLTSKFVLTVGEGASTLISGGLVSDLISGERSHKFDKEGLDRIRLRRGKVEFSAGLSTSSLVSLGSEPLLKALRSMPSFLRGFDSTLVFLTGRFGFNSGLSAWSLPMVDDKLNRKMIRYIWNEII